MNFNLYSKYYDLLYSDKEYLLETEYVIKRLKELSSIKLDYMLELGGGSGNHAVHFSKFFKEIHGVELSHNMVKIAQSRNIPKYNVLQGDISNIHFPDKHFDCAVSLFHVVSYLNTNEQLLNCFTSINKQLKQNGIFIFDVWFTPAVYFLKPETRVKKIQNKEISVTRIAQSTIDYQSSIVNVNYSIFVEDLDTKEFFKFEETHNMRHFTINEIQLIANFTGFEIVKTEEFLTEKSPSNETWGCMYVIRKKIEL
jgi:SAM-dependent methyltransferase